MNLLKVKDIALVALDAKSQFDEKVYCLLVDYKTSSPERDFESVKHIFPHQFKEVVFMTVSEIPDS